MKRQADSELSSEEPKKLATGPTEPTNPNETSTNNFSTPASPPIIAKPVFHPMMPLSAPTFSPLSLGAGGYSPSFSFPISPRNSQVFQAQRAFQQNDQFSPTNPASSQFGLPKPNIIGSRFPHLANEKKPISNVDDASKKQVEELKKAHRKAIFAPKQENEDMIFCLPDGHQLDYFPKLHLGRHAAHANEFTVDEFWVKIRYSLGFAPGFNILNLKQSLVLELKNSDRTKTLLQYDSEKMTISEDGPANLPRSNNNNSRVQSHIIPLDDQKTCKAINGRSDGMKSNVQEFRKKERVLEVSFNDSKTAYTFAVAVICCSSSSFQIALRPYREEEDKIREFGQFLDCLAKYKTIMRPLTQQDNNQPPTVPNKAAIPAIQMSQQQYNQTPAMSPPEIQSLTEFFLKEKATLHNTMPADVALFYEDRISLENFMEFYLIRHKPNASPRFQTDVKQAWAAIFKFMNEMLQPRMSTLKQIRMLANLFGNDEGMLATCSSPYFGGFVLDPFNVAHAIESSFQCGAGKWRYPGGCMTMVISKYTLHGSNIPFGYGGQKLPSSADTYYLFLIESPIWNEARLQYLLPNSRTWSHEPQCSVRPYKITGTTITLLMTEPDRNSPAFERFDFSELNHAPKSWTFENLEQHYRLRHYEPYISDSVSEGTSLPRGFRLWLK